MVSDITGHLWSVLQHLPGLPYISFNSGLPVTPETLGHFTVPNDHSNN